MLHGMGHQVQKNSNCKPGSVVPPQDIPKLTSGELLRATIEDLKVLLFHPPTDSFVGNMEPNQWGQLINLQELLHQVVALINMTTETPAPSGARSRVHRPGSEPRHRQAVGVQASVYLLSRSKVATGLLQGMGETFPGFQRWERRRT
jgi:hypothetical protein